MTFDEQKRAIHLWIQFLEGNEKAFSELYCLYFDDLLRYGHRVCGDTEMIEDLIQDIFLKLYQRKIILEDNTKLRPFLYRSLKNLIYNQLLRNAKVQPLPGEYNYEFDLTYIMDEQSTIAADNNLSEEVENILRTLSGRQKEVIYLRYVHELSFEEISDIMEINVQSARNLLTRSMEKLRKESRPYFILLLINSAQSCLYISELSA